MNKFIIFFLVFCFLIIVAEDKKVKYQLTTNHLRAIFNELISNHTQIIDAVAKVKRSKNRTDSAVVTIYSLYLFLHATGSNQLQKEDFDVTTSTMEKWPACSGGN